MTWVIIVTALAMLAMFGLLGNRIIFAHLIVVAAEDNLLKGAASQAVQCLNIRFGFPETQSLI